MINMVAFVFTCLATVYVLADSDLPGISHLRRFVSYDFEFVAEILTCPFCLGFWVGIAWSFGFEIPLELADQTPIVKHFILGLVASGACGILYRE